MLIKCPRCGFQQPQDKYCAQCGVDMETFKPPEPSSLQKLIGHLGLQLGLLLLLAVGAGIYVYQSNRENLQNRVSYLRSAVQINSANLNLPPPPPPPASAPSADANPAPASETDNQTQKTDVASKASPTSKADSAETKEKERSVAKAQGPRILVYYAEVNRGALGNIFEASQATGQFMSFKDYTAGILPGIEKRLSASNVKILHTEERSLSTSKTLQWSYGLKDRRDPSVEIGLTTFFELNDLDDSNTLRGNLEIQRTWREPSPTGGFEIQRKSFPAIFEIGSGTGFFISGVMPTQSNLENDDELTSMDIYKILRSPRFHSGDSDFVIFVEFERNN